MSGAVGIDAEDNQWEDYLTVFTKIKSLANHNIIDISTGSNHSMFLDENGAIWSCGRNWKGECGIGVIGAVVEPVQIEYFVKNNVRIIKVECGKHFSVTICLNEFSANIVIS